MDVKPKRRWSRFSLRTAFVLVTIACISFGWLGYKVREKKREREAVAALTNAGGKVLYDYQIALDDDRMRSVTPPGPEWLRRALGDNLFAHVVSVEFSH